MKKNIYILISLILTAGIIWLLADNKAGRNFQQTAGNSNLNIAANAIMEKDGVQYINILVRGGYTPSQIKAKAGVTTKLVFETKGTYDCSSAISIPQLNYRAMLPATGSTVVEIPAEKAQNNLDIVCSVGMFRAQIEFASK